MFGESATIDPYPGNLRPLYINVPSYTSLYRTSHALVLARNPKVAGSNPAHATNEIKGLGEKLNPL
jgi:hypothetical protein